jgi:hypothetical protein
MDNRLILQNSIIEFTHENLFGIPIFNSILFL